MGLRLRHLPNKGGTRFPASAVQHPATTLGSRKGAVRSMVPGWRGRVYLLSAALVKVTHFWSIWAIPYNSSYSQCFINGPCAHRSRSKRRLTDLKAKTQMPLCYTRRRVVKLVRPRNNSTVSFQNCFLFLPLYFSLSTPSQRSPPKTPPQSRHDFEVFSWPTLCLLEEEVTTSFKHPTSSKVRLGISSLWPPTHDTPWENTRGGLTQQPIFAWEW